MHFNWIKTFESPKLILIGGRPCMGKSTAALKLAGKIATPDKVGVIEPEKCLSIQDFEKQLYDKWDNDVLVVDTIQKLTGCMEGNDSSVLDRLKKLVDQKWCSVIVTSELSRDLEYRDNHFPSLSDFKLGAVERNIFDFAGLLYRESYYNPAGSKDTYLVFKDTDNKNSFFISFTE